ncbi:MAG: DUF4276 family protein [Prochlorothrix sp.]|nr:DUF4276 family protein [Prochlorothrix sp.]
MVNRSRQAQQPKEIRIYVEGGGDNKDTKAQLRQGMHEFLQNIYTEARKNRIRKNRIKVNLTACGRRNSAFEDYCNALKSHPTAINILLVDAEAAVTKDSVLKHLGARDPSWQENSQFRHLDEDTIHLMVQVMETWLLADPDCLEKYYGQGFLANSLPKAANLENVPKNTVEQALNHATEKTQKGKYHKINHGLVLLGRLDPAKVRQRCPHCDRFCTYLETHL